MDLNTLSPYVRVAWDSVIEPPFHLTERVLFDYELLFVKGGEIEVTVEDRVYDGVPGDLFLFKPMQPHSIRLRGDKPLRQPHLHFDLFYQPDSPLVSVSFKPYRMMSEQEKRLFRPDATRYMPVPLPNHIRLSKPDVIESLMFDIIFEFERKLPFYETTVKGLFIQLWGQLLRERHWQDNASIATLGEQLDRVKTYLDHSTGKEVTLDELSQLANLSKSHLCRAFKKAFGLTPIQYHVAVRLAKAKQLIRFTDLSLTSIAEELGFHSIHAFSRAFRKREGVSPSLLRK